MGKKRTQTLKQNREKDVKKCVKFKVKEKTSMSHENSEPLNEKPWKHTGKEKF